MRWSSRGIWIIVLVRYVSSYWTNRYQVVIVRVRRQRGLLHVLCKACNSAIGPEVRHCPFWTVHVRALVDPNGNARASESRFISDSSIYSDPRLVFAPPSSLGRRRRTAVSIQAISDRKKIWRGQWKFRVAHIRSFWLKIEFHVILMLMMTSREFLREHVIEGCLGREKNLLIVWIIKIIQYLKSVSFCSPKTDR